MTTTISGQPVTLHKIGAIADLGDAYHSLGLYPLARMTRTVLFENVTKRFGLTFPATVVYGVQLGDTLKLIWRALYAT